MFQFLNFENYQIGDEITWHAYGSKDYYTSKIVGFYRDPQVQGLTSTKKYIESLDKLEYKADTIYTNDDLSKISSIKNVSIIQDKKKLKNSVTQMLSMVKTMIVIIIYNMGVLSYGEKQYQFSTLKVLGFQDRKIRRIFEEQNS